MGNNQLKTVVLDYHGLNPGDLDDKKFIKLVNPIIYPYTSADELLERTSEAQVLVVNKTKIDKDTISKLPLLKALIITATGYDNVDVKYLDKKGIFWSNVVDYSTPSVVQHTFALLLAALNRSAYYGVEVKQGLWSSQRNFSYWNHPIYELRSKVIGLIGFGNIAQEVAKVALAFGMQVVVNHRTPRVDYPKGISYLELDELLSVSDVVSLHLPANRESEGMVNTSFLEKMKSSAILINTARGAILNEQDLAGALKNKTISFAALDVLTQEPPSKNNPLLKSENCLITPHQAWASVESRQRLLNKVLEIFKEYLFKAY